MWSTVMNGIGALWLRPSVRVARIGAALAALTSIVGVVAHAAEAFPPLWLVSLVDVLLGALAIGWVLRSGVHALASYFALPARNVVRRRVMLLSVLNGLGTAVWLVAAIRLRSSLDAAAQFGALAAASVWVFVMSLCTLVAARAAGLQRGSEWVREHLRDAVEPGRRTWLGWLIVRLIDWRSDVKSVSTYVTGTSALLLIGLVLMAPAFVRILTTTGGTDASDPVRVAAHEGRQPRSGGALRPRPAGSSARPARGRSRGWSPTVPLAAAPDSDSQPRRSIGYNDVCAGAAQPGDGAPKPASLKLHGLWLGSVAVGGAGIVGCAEEARPARGHPDLYVMEGRCGDELRSLGIAPLAGDASLLLQQAARYALRLANEGNLVGASGRLSVGGGDLYLIYGDDGTHILVRALAGHGSSPVRSSDDPCREPRADEQPYVEMPPAAADLMMQFVRAHGWVWPRPTIDGFVLRREPGAKDIAAMIVCSGDSHCVLDAGREVLKREAPAPTMSADDLLRFAPSPVG
jgi:hypothetical protein